MLKTIGIGLLVVVVIVAILYLVITRIGLQALENIQYAEVDVSQVSDGTYSGVTDAGPVKVELEVTVKDHHIEAITIIKHQNGKGSQAEALIPVMIEQNTFKVDAIMGATYSSEAIKSAVSHALKSGVKEVTP